MATKTIKTIVALRRGAEADYSSAAIPLNGEVAFVESNDGSVRFKVGDGETNFGDLEFADEYLIDMINNIVIQGYYINGEFYKDTQKKVKIVPYTYKLYVDLNTDVIYRYDGEVYKASSAVIPAASSQVAGIMKLYDSTGANTDGTMTQKVISDEIAKRFIVTADSQGEQLLLTNGLVINE